MSTEMIVHHSSTDLTAATALDHNPAAVYLASLTSPHSRRNMCHNLDVIADVLTSGQADALAVQWGALRYQHTAAIRAALAQKYAPATVNMMLSALRGTLKAAWQLGQMSAEDYQRSIDFKTVKGTTLPAGRDLTGSEIMALADACAADKSPAGVRDAAMIAVLYSCGLRRAELAALARDDFEASTGKIEVRSGKGRKDRAVYAKNGARDALTDWLAIRGGEPGPLFYPVNKGGKVTAAPITSQTVYNVLKKRAKEAAVTDFSPHDFRRTFVGDLLDKGVDIVTVQKLAGHASPITTSRYDRRPEKVKEAASDMLHFPYRRRNR